LRLYDTLFTVPKPDEAPDFKSVINPQSSKFVRGAKWSRGRGGAPEDHVQFERVGYFVRTGRTTGRRPVFNRSVGLRDTWPAREDRPGVLHERSASRRPQAPAVFSSRAQVSRRPTLRLKTGGRAGVLPVRDEVAHALELHVVLRRGLRDAGSTLARGRLRATAVDHALEVGRLVGLRHLKSGVVEPHLRVHRVAAETQ